MCVSLISHRREVYEFHAILIKNLACIEVGLCVCDSAACRVNTSTDFNRLVIPQGSCIPDKVLMLAHVVKIEEQNVVLVQKM